jgi:DNA polymerase-3 subunit epsilon
MELIVFDTETNGLFPPRSVLSITAVRCGFEGNSLIERDVFDRCYFRQPDEAPDWGALRVNGLTDAVIRELRSDADYPAHFLEDIPQFKEFCAGVSHFVGHNISFDAKFIPFPLPHTFCTMRENTDILKIPPVGANGRSEISNSSGGLLGRPNAAPSPVPVRPASPASRRRGYKFPRLEETAAFYRIPLDRDRFHDSAYDTRITKEILQRMLDNPTARERVLRFLETTTGPQESVPAMAAAALED